MTIWILVNDYIHIPFAQKVLVIVKHFMPDPYDVLLRVMLAQRVIDAGRSVSRVIYRDKRLLAAGIGPRVVRKRACFLR